MSIRKNLLFTVVGISLTMVAVVGCGSGDGEAGDDAPFVATEENPVQILQPDGVFTVANVEAAGWKNSKELSPETLPDATGVWYGFYQQRDVEVRVYESQQTAIASGQEIADVATGRRKPAPFASGGISSNRVAVIAYWAKFFPSSDHIRFDL